MNFTLTKDELKKLEEWKSTQKKEYLGPIDGQYVYSFTPVSVGVIVNVTNRATGESICLTDFDSW